MVFIDVCVSARTSMYDYLSIFLNLLLFGPFQVVQPNLQVVLFI